MVVRVGLIGTSWWADAMYAPPLSAHEQAVIAAVAGRNPATTAAFADRWNIPERFDDPIAVDVEASRELPAERYRDVAAALAETFDVIVPSVPGFGYSPAPPPGLGGPAWTADLLVDALRQVGVERFGVYGGDIRTSMLIAAAFIEGVTLFAEVVCIILATSKPAGVRSSPL